MTKASVALGALAAIWLSCVSAAPGWTAVPAQPVQNAATPTLPAALKAQLDQAVQQALAANRSADSKTLAAAVAASVGQIIAAQADAIGADPMLAAAVAQEAIAVAGASLGADSAALVQLASAVAATASAAVPTASASIFVAVVQALPAGQQNLQNQTLIAQAIDAVVPDAQITASIAGLTSPASPPNPPVAITTLTPLLTVLSSQENVSPH